MSDGGFCKEGHLNVFTLPLTPPALFAQDARDKEMCLWDLWS